MKHNKTYLCPYGNYTLDELNEELNSTLGDLKECYIELGSRLSTIYRLLPKTAELVDKVRDLQNGKAVLEYEKEKDKQHE